MQSIKKQRKGYSYYGSVASNVIISKFTLFSFIFQLITSKSNKFFDNPCVIYCLTHGYPLFHGTILPFSSSPSFPLSHFLFLDFPLLWLSAPTFHFQLSVLSLILPYFLSSLFFYPIFSSFHLFHCRPIPVFRFYLSSLVVYVQRSSVIVHVVYLLSAWICARVSANDAIIISLKSLLSDCCKDTFRWQGRRYRAGSQRRLVVAAYLFYVFACYVLQLILMFGPFKT